MTLIKLINRYKAVYFLFTKIHVDTKATMEIEIGDTDNGNAINKKGLT